MRTFVRILSALLALCTLALCMAGCKVVEIPEDAYFVSKSASSFVEELNELEDAKPIDDSDILYLDKLNDCFVFVDKNPDTTESLILEKEDGSRTRLYTGAYRRMLLYPMLNDSCTTVAFIMAGDGAKIGNRSYVGQLITVELDSGNTVSHDIYIRSYEDFPRGYYWYNDDTIFVSSGLLGLSAQEDCIGFYSVTNQTINNIVGGEHPVDSARQGVLSPDGKTICYSGYYESNSNYVHCVFDISTGETTYWMNKSDNGMGTDVYYDFLDNDHIIKTRTYKMPVDADGNIIYDEESEAVEQEDMEEAENLEELPEESESAAEESEVEPDTEAEAVTDADAETSDASEEESTEEETTEDNTVVINSIFIMDIHTGDLEMLVENACRSCLDADKEYLYFHHTIYADLEDTSNVGSRVFRMNLSTGEIEEVTESMGLTYSYDVLFTQQRAFE